MYHLIFQPTVSTFNQGTLYFSHQTHSSPIAATIFKLKFKCFVDFYLEWCLDLFGKKEKKKEKKEFNTKFANVITYCLTTYLHGCCMSSYQTNSASLAFLFFFRFKSQINQSNSEICAFKTC